MIPRIWALCLAVHNFAARDAASRIVGIDEKLLIRARYDSRAMWFGAFYNLRCCAQLMAGARRDRSVLACCRFVRLRSQDPLRVGFEPYLD
jgi:hypothetical protein